MQRKPEHSSGKFGLREDESSELSSGIKRDEPYVRGLRGISLSETGCHMKHMVLLLCSLEPAIQEADYSAGVTCTRRFRSRRGRALKKRTPMTVTMMVATVIPMTNQNM